MVSHQNKPVYKPNFAIMKIHKDSSSQALEDLALCPPGCEQSLRMWLPSLRRPTALKERWCKGKGWREHASPATWQTHRVLFYLSHFEKEKACLSSHLKPNTSCLLWYIPLPHSSAWATQELSLGPSLDPWLLWVKLTLELTRNTRELLLPNQLLLSDRQSWNVIYLNH